MSVDIGIYVGGLTSPNIQREVDNIGWMLKGEFSIGLVSTEPHLFQTEHYSQVVGENFPSNLLGSFKAVRKFLIESNPAILLHTNRPQIHGNIVPLSTILSSKNDVTSVYRYSGDTFNLYRVAKGWKKIPYFLLNNVIGRIPLLLADKFIVLGGNGKRQLINRNVSSSDIATLPVAIDVDKFKNVEFKSLPIPKNKSIALFLGRRTHLKGIKTLEDKMDEIVDRRPDLHFVFVGKGQSLQVQDKLEKHVTVIGEVPPAMVPHYLKVADVLIHPSLIEGMPFVLLEALASNTPVIAREVGEIPEITQNTFNYDDEFVDMVCCHESLNLDSVDRFNRENLKTKYIEYIKNISTN